MYEVSESLDKTWSKDLILSKIKSGETVDIIVNNFLNENKQEVQKIIDLVNNENYSVLDNLISLSECELELIKRIKNLEPNKSDHSKPKHINQIELKNKKIFNINLFLSTWSNKFVIIALIAISLISLTKQAWA